MSAILKQGANELTATESAELTRCEAIIERGIECGSVMCIAGHALDLQGYRFRVVELDGIREAQFVSSEGRRVREPLRKAAREMGIDYADVAFDLFHDFSIRTPRQAAERIDQLITEHSDAKA